MPDLDRQTDLPAGQQLADPEDRGHAPRACFESSGRVLRLISYNIQTGTTTSRYRHYLTQGWKQMLPHAQRMDNLARIAELLADYDVVGLQEVDAGSLRSGFINQTEYIAHLANFPYWYHQTTRRIGVFAQHSNGFLSRFRPSEVDDHRLPGAIPGRGALFVRFGTGPESLVIVILHLALGRRSRTRQLSYIRELASEYRHVVIMGDMNCRSDSPEIRALVAAGNLCEPAHNLYTFPSWRPERNIDHILVSPSLEVHRVRVLGHTFSDHLPIAMDVVLPEDVRLGTSRPDD